MGDIGDKAALALSKQNCRRTADVRQAAAAAYGWWSAIGHSGSENGDHRKNIGRQRHQPGDVWRRSVAAFAGMAKTDGGDSVSNNVKASKITGAWQRSEKRKASAAAAAASRLIYLSGM
jgi:hypothetical protein